MYRTAFNLILALVQAPQQTSHIISSEIAISRERAEIKLELDNGRKLTLATTTGPAVSEVTATGDQNIALNVNRGDVLDRSWRDLLNAAMEASGPALGAMLTGWHSPTPMGESLDQALEAAIAGGASPPAPPAALKPGMNDTLVKLEQRIQQLEEQLDEARGRATTAARRNRGPDWLAPVRHVARGITGIFATIITYAVIFGLGFVTIMLGGRKYIEGVADTVRGGMGRAFLVGLAGSFLLIPVWILGAIALAISIVGIPALLIWIPLFPIAALLGVALGFLGVAHATGENWAERQYTGTDWYTRANSYYFLGAGLALLSALFIAANVITMAGPWLGFINNLLNFLGIVITWGACTIGLGAVLISRGGSRTEANGTLGQTSFAEDANV